MKKSEKNQTSLVRSGILLFSIISALVLSGCPLKPDIMLGLSLLAKGFTHPVGMAVPDDGTGRIFIVDQIGKISVIDAAGNLLSQPFLDVIGKMVTLDSGYDERGLLGMAFHPQYSTNKRFFVFYNVPRQPADPDGFDSRVRLSEFVASESDPNIADAASEQVLLEVNKPQSNHNGGQLAFGPDGYLYVGIGDGGGANDTGLGHTEDIGNGQDLTKLLGKILRYDVSTPGVLQIPESNPFAGGSVAQPAIYAYGFRNPWRFSFDAGGAHQLFCADVGQNLYEEVDIVTAGANYGWNIREGLSCFDPQNPNRPPDSCPDIGGSGEPLIDPIIEYSHQRRGTSITGKAVVGGFVYRGSAMPELQGAYIFGDWSSSFINANGSILVATEIIAETWQVSEAGIAGCLRRKLNKYVLGFGQDLQGELYILTARRSGPSGDTGEVFKIIPAQ
jgi:glucose/arabinose dehydrogenase